MWGLPAVVIIYSYLIKTNNWINIKQQQMSVEKSHIMFANKKWIFNKLPYCQYQAEVEWSKTMIISLLNLNLSINNHLPVLFGTSTAWNGPEEKTFQAAFSRTAVLLLSYHGHVQNNYIIKLFSSLCPQSLYCQQWGRNRHFSLYFPHMAKFNINHQFVSSCSNSKQQNKSLFILKCRR